MATTVVVAKAVVVVAAVAEAATLAAAVAKTAAVAVAVAAFSTLNSSSGENYSIALNYTKIVLEFSYFDFKVINNNILELIYLFNIL